MVEQLGVVVDAERAADGLDVRRRHVGRQALRVALPRHAEEHLEGRPVDVIDVGVGVGRLAPDVAVAVSDDDATSVQASRQPPKARRQVSPLALM